MEKTRVVDERVIIPSRQRPIPVPSSTPRQRRPSTREVNLTAGDSPPTTPRTSPNGVPKLTPTTSTVACCTDVEFYSRPVTSSTPTTTENSSEQPTELGPEIDWNVLVTTPISRLTAAARNAAYNTEHDHKPAVGVMSPYLAGGGSLYFPPPVETVDVACNTTLILGMGRTGFLPNRTEPNI